MGRMRGKKKRRKIKERERNNEENEKGCRDCCKEDRQNFEKSCLVFFKSM